IRRRSVDARERFPRGRLLRLGHRTDRRAVRDVPRLRGRPPHPGRLLERRRGGLRRPLQRCPPCPSGPRSRLCGLRLPWRGGRARVPGVQVVGVSGIGPYPGHFPWLTVVTFAPLAGAAIMLFVPRSRVSLHRWLALLVTLITFGLSIGMLAAYDAENSGQLLHLVDHATWSSTLHLQYFL